MVTTIEEKGLKLPGVFGIVTMELRKGGEFYEVSPWALLWEDENYYLIGFDSASQEIRHYRVDKMMRISIEEEKRDGKEAFKNFDMATYSKATFKQREEA